MEKLLSADCDASGKDNSPNNNIPNTLLKNYTFPKTNQIKDAHQPSTKCNMAESLTNIEGMLEKRHDNLFEVFSNSEGLANKRDDDYKLDFGHVPQTSTESTFSSTNPEGISDSRRIDSGKPVKVNIKCNEHISPRSKLLSYRKRTGVGAMLGCIPKKKPLTILEKSKLDWENFKSKEDLSEELNTYNKGKKGYLERQDFLERSDIRQFEIERRIREKIKRSDN